MKLENGWVNVVGFRTWRSIIAVAVLVSGGVSFAADSPAERAVPSFYAGLAALKMGLFERAEQDLQRAGALLPGEPAIPANLAVIAMRLGDDDRALDLLHESRKLAPEAAEIHFLLGLLERRRGNREVAIEALRRAVSLAPHALKPRYALAMLLAENSAGNGLEEAIQLFDELISDDPQNLALRIAQVPLLAKADRHEELVQAVNWLDSTSAPWPEAARKQLFELHRVLGDDSRTVMARSMMLRNVLLRFEGYRQALSEVQVPAQAGGEPIEAFLIAQVPNSGPAPADAALGYELAPLTSPLPGDFDALVLNAKGPGSIVPAADEALPSSLRQPALSFDARLESPETLAVDLDNDGAVELVVANSTGVRVFHQGKEGDLAPVDKVLPVEFTQRSYRGVWAADIELDGDMDLVLGPAEGSAFVLRNNGDGSFLLTEPFPDINRLAGLVWADFDMDGLPDAATLDSTGQVNIFPNARGGNYKPPVPVAGTYLAMAATDFDWDGELDLVLYSSTGALVALLDGQVRPFAKWPEFERQVKPGGAGLFAADLDNNGAADFLVSAGAESRVWLTGADRRSEMLEKSIPIRVSMVTEMTGDGRLDLVGHGADGQMALATAEGKFDYGWQAIRPRALENAGDNRINTFGFGGQVEVRSGLLVQRRVIDSPELHFGLGARQNGTDVAWFLWPNGTSQAEFDLPARQAVEAVQRLKGSCPWLFANDGSGIRFVTDFLWRSPLGMRINAVDTATITQIEDRVRIPGQALARLDGEYELRVTAELWETHFIDGVALLAVDHAPGTQIFIDERFSRQPPDQEPVLTSDWQPVGSVVDDQGRDWTEEAARAGDDRYVAGLDLGRYQGLTRPHHVEIDLTDQDLGDHAVLLATGWVYPTDSSINVAVAQGAGERPGSVRLEVADGRGGWRVARADLGFPAGKHKTMIIDLKGVFGSGAPKRLRLATNLEVYWDRLATAQVRTAARASGTRLELTRAELRYRGFSKTTIPSRAHPEQPIYASLQGSGQRWPDLVGYHTRFGDVRELLAKQDDRYVIMNAGDEIVLRFAGPPPAAGLQRDFVLIGHGWVKDGDYNTAFSRTVLPLPSKDRPEYDAPPSTLEDDPVYQRFPDDWTRFHTRYVEPSEFLSGLRTR